MTRARGSVPPGEAPVGVIYAVDGILRFATVRRQLRRVRAMLTRSTRDRRSVQGMPRVLQALVARRPHVTVYYLTALPSFLARPVTRLLRRDGYPSDTLLMNNRGLVPRWVVGGDLEHKPSTTDALVDRMPERRWVLVGDDAGHDPSLFAEVARCRPERAAVIALRQVLDVDPPESGVPSRPEPVAGVTEIEAPNGEELLPLLRASIGVELPREAAVGDWFLTDGERDNDATQLRAWTEGNAAARRMAYPAAR